MNPRVSELLKIPQYEQRSAEWFAQRENALTSSDLDTVLGRNKYSDPIDVLFRKCGLSAEFTGNDATRHGQKYEDEAIQVYCSLHNKKALSFGLLPHPTISWLAGSPDGITEDGIVIEVKCPLYRKLEHGKIPDHYLSQVLMNMEICDLDEAVFIEYVPKELLLKVDPNSKEDYDINIVHIKRDPSWFPSVFPILEKFWLSVLHYRKVGIKEHPEYAWMYNRLRPKKGLYIDSVECHIIDDE